MWAYHHQQWTAKTRIWLLVREKYHQNLRHNNWPWHFSKCNKSSVTFGTYLKTSRSLFPKQWCLFSHDLPTFTFSCQLLPGPRLPGGPHWSFSFVLPLAKRWQLSTLHCRAPWAKHRRPMGPWWSASCHHGLRDAVFQASTGSPLHRARKKVYINVEKKNTRKTHICVKYHVTGNFLK